MAGKSIIDITKQENGRFTGDPVGFFHRSFPAAKSPQRDFFPELASTKFTSVTSNINL
jgi:hypothetical protein